MSIPGSGSPLLFSAEAAAAAGADTKSLRFTSGDSAYLNKTFSSAGNRKTFTWSGWFKIGKTVAGRTFLSAADTATADRGCFICSPDNATNAAGLPDSFGLASAAAADNLGVFTAGILRDHSAWYHAVIAIDTTQSTESDRVKIYINGVESDKVTYGGGYPSLNQELRLNNGTAVNHSIGAEIRYSSGPRFFYDGYLADVYFIDGQALAATDFGEFDSTTGAWNPIEYTGSYGTNGFHLDFSDNSSVSALGTDAAGSNDWTPNNFSVTAGAGNDSLFDSPTNGTQTDTGAGGEVSGNYATLNPLAKTGATTTLSNGNLEATGDRNSYATIALPASGKWYWEVTPTAGSYPMIGVAEYVATSTASYTDTSMFYYGVSGDKYNAGSNSSYGATYTTSDVIGVAVDIDSGTVTFYKNGSSQGSITYDATGLFPASTTAGGSATYTFNFGQRAFNSSAPSGYKALCTANFDTPTIQDPSTVMDIVLYSGNSSTQTITGLNHDPDMVWIKRRDQLTGYSNAIQDQVRGYSKGLITNRTDSEYTYNSGEDFTGFTTGGFSLGTPYSVDINNTSATYVAWAWDAGTSTASNTSGTLTSQVRANISAGFSILTFGAGSQGDTVGHGLGVAPDLIIVKQTDAGSHWPVYHSALGNNNAVYLNLTNAAVSGNYYWNSTDPTSSVFTIGPDGDVKDDNKVAYCWAAVEGYSAFGSYTGNGSTDGPFVYTGFRPKWLMVKVSNQVDNWVIVDAERNTYNSAGLRLFPNTSGAESSFYSEYFDLLSNGFKARSNDGGSNASSDTYIYAAFAESPLRYARAR